MISPFLLNNNDVHGFIFKGVILVKVIIKDCNMNPFSRILINIKCCFKFPFRVVIILLSLTLLSVFHMSVFRKDQLLQICPSFQYPLLWWPWSEFVHAPISFLSFTSEEAAEELGAMSRLFSFFVGDVSSNSVFSAVLLFLSSSFGLTLSFFLLLSWCWI